MARTAKAWGAFGPSVSTERSTEGFDRAQPRASRRGLDEVSGRGLEGYPLNFISFAEIQFKGPMPHNYGKKGGLVEGPPPPPELLRRPDDAG